MARRQEIDFDPDGALICSAGDKHTPEDDY